MKKCLSSILALALTFSLVGCSGGSGSTPSASGSASGDSSDPKVSMNVSVPDADNSYIYAAAQEFKSRVEEYSNGSIELTIYPNGSLYGGDGNAAISSVGNGSLDIVILASSLYASFDPSFYVVSVPYLFDDTKQLQDYLNSDIGKDLFNSVESMGITCLGSWTRSFRQVTNSKKPINSLLNEQKDFDRRINGMAYDEDEFASLQETEQTTHEIENRIRLDIEESKQQIERISMPIAAWDVYKRGQDALQHMQALADVSQFPADGAQKWAELEQNIKAIDDQVRKLKATSRKGPAFQESWNRWLACGPPAR